MFGPDWSTRPLLVTLAGAVAYLLGFLAVLFVCQGIVGIANAFLLKQRGVVGQHVLEITGPGLVERTEFNETLHKWASIGRIFSLFGYLYIYVSDNNYHQLPKRCFTGQEIAAFEAELRAHARPANP
jgi:hypothetical protein